MSTNLSHFPAKLVPLVSCVIAASTIGICYFLATSAGHTPPFPHTDITHCALYAPERFIFRVGMLTASTFMMLLWYLMGAWTSFVAPSRHDINPGLQLESILGYIASWCLIISSAVLESDGTTMWPLHVFCASSFFILSIVAQVIVTVKVIAAYRNADTPIDSRSALSGSSVTARAIVTCLQIIGLLIDLSLGFINAPSSSAKALEWILTGLIIAYHMIAYFDWQKCNLAVGAVLVAPSSFNSYQRPSAPHQAEPPMNADTDTNSASEPLAPSQDQPRRLRRQSSLRFYAGQQRSTPSVHVDSPYVRTNYAMQPGFPHYPHEHAPQEGNVYPQTHYSRAQPQPVYHIPRHGSSLDAEFEEIQRLHSGDRKSVV